MRLRKPRTIYIVGLTSLILGILICLALLQTKPSSTSSVGRDVGEDIQITAYFRNDELVIIITNSGSTEIEVQMVLLEGKNYVDFDALINTVVNPGEKKEIKTNIIKPRNPGTYTVKIRLSNGRVINYNIVVR
jgi:hypothetical protein